MKPHTRVLRKAFAHLQLLRRDPEAFIRNVRQFTHPQRFLADLLDVTDIAQLRVTVAEGVPATLNVLLPVIARHGISGGPNTVLAIGGHLAHAGLRVRFVSCDAPLDTDAVWFWNHLEQLTGVAGRPAGATLADACAMPLHVGARDLLLASFWTTAHQAASLLPMLRAREFLYLIQDYEPGFYPWSSRHAQALASYSLPFRAIVNEATLADFLTGTRAGRFAEAGFRARCTVFEPAVDRRLFFPPPASHAAGDVRRLLVYARPTNPRNLLGIAVAALRAAVARGVFPGAWEFLAIGARGSLPEIDLGGGAVLREAPWRDLPDYAASLREADILLCAMLSPHTSYPVLEMAACGGLVVTNSFATKTAARLAAISPDIIAVEPGVDGFAAGLAEAAARLGTRHRGTARVASPETWPAALMNVEAMMREMMAAADA